METECIFCGTVGDSTVDHGCGREPFEAYGVKGMKSTPWRRTFANADAYERWILQNAGDVEVHGTRPLDRSR